MGWEARPYVEAQRSRLAHQEALVAEHAALVEERGARIAELEATAEAAKAGRRGKQTTPG